jgi:hypothetical protein
VLSYDELPQSNSFSALKSFQDHSGIAYPSYITASLSDLGFDGQNIYSDIESDFSPDDFRDRALLYYNGHGSGGGGNGGFKTKTLREEDIWFPSSIVIADTCSTCRYVLGDANVNLFCPEMIRRGAVAYTGATDENASNAKTYLNFFTRLLKSKDLGTAFRDAMNVTVVDHGLLYDPWAILLGDPTFNPQFFGNGSRDKLHVTKGDFFFDNGQWILPVTVTLEAVDTVSHFGYQRDSTLTCDSVDAPYYGGDNIRRGSIQYYHGYPTEPGNGADETITHYASLSAVIDFDNIMGLELLGVRAAIRQIGEETPIDCTATYEPQFNGPVAYTTTENKTIVGFHLFFNNEVIIDETTTVTPEIQFDIELAFY